MIILRPYEARFLMPVKKSEWMAPSLTLPKDHFGNDGVRTRFKLTARLHDGHVVWRGWFDDRDDFDAFLFALFSGSLLFERSLWDLPSPVWRPDLGEDILYYYAVQNFLTVTGSNQTYTSPIDWVNSANAIHCIGGGGSGGLAMGTAHSTGGGGGSYSKITNFSFATPGTTTATYRVGATVVTPTISVTGTQAGVNGNPTWFNDTVNPGVGTTNAKCSAAGGSAGAVGTGSRNGGAGGLTTASWGQTKYAGGRGGNLTGASGTGGSGGGGAAGPDGAGGAGGDDATTSLGVETAGGQGGNGSGGPGGGASSTTKPAGGTEFSVSPAYSSGGGGGANCGSGNSSAGDGGNYGGGGGGRQTTSTSGNNTSGDGTQGLIVVEYTPVAPPFSLANQNIPMIGM